MFDLIVCGGGAALLDPHLNPNLDFHCEEYELSIAQGIQEGGDGSCLACSPVLGTL